MLGSELGASDEMCSTTNTAAARSLGRPRASDLNASTPPADAPTTTMSLLATQLTDPSMIDSEEAQYTLAGRGRGVGHRLTCGPVATFARSSTTASTRSRWLPATA